jgi:general nucleoside transport system ATP-binding protein
VKLSGIRKSFGSKRVLEDVTLEIRPGEIHAVLGENGAGKSTLMKIIYGLERADAGSFEMDGKAVQIRSPREAASLGIGMVHQHFQLVEDRSVADNLYLALGEGFLLSPQALKKNLEARFPEQVRGLDFEARVGSLPLTLKQRIEILKALISARKVLILDEPTAIAIPSEAEALYADLKNLASKGLAIVVVTHKLEEVLEQAHRVSVLRNGKVALFAEVKGLGHKQLADAIVGGDFEAENISHSGVSTTTEIQVEVVGAPQTKGPRGKFKLQLGRITGIAGVGGQGQEAWFHGIAGDCPKELGFEIRVGEKTFAPSDSETRRKQGVRLIPAERHAEGLFLDESILFNISVGQQHDPEYWQSGRVRLGAAVRNTHSLIESYEVKSQGPFERVRSLSGGNQQKVLIARELAAYDKIPEIPLVLALDPSRGVDIAAQRKIHLSLRALSERGCAVALYSHDLDELHLLADVLWVAYEGALLGPFGADLSKAQIGSLMTTGKKLK